MVITTGHRGDEHEALEWNKLVTSGATVAIYMPGTDYQRLADELAAAGLTSCTPCTIVSRAGRPDQQVYWTNLSQLPSLAPLPAPSILLVGQCAAALPDTATMAPRLEIKGAENKALNDTYV